MCVCLCVWACVRTDGVGGLTEWEWKKLCWIYIAKKDLHHYYEKRKIFLDQYEPMMQLIRFWWAVNVWVIYGKHCKRTVNIRGTPFIDWPVPKMCCSRTKTHGTTFVFGHSCYTSDWLGCLHLISTATVIQKRAGPTINTSPTPTCLHSINIMHHFSAQSSNTHSHTHTDNMEPNTLHSCHISYTEYACVTSTFSTSSFTVDTVVLKPFIFDLEL